MEPRNFGTVRFIGVVLPYSVDPVTKEKTSNKPINLDVKYLYPQLTPKEEILSEYQETKKISFKQARMDFLAAYDNQLKQFCKAVETEAEKQGKTPQDILDLKDGDTLLSWERSDRTHYRNMLGGWLEYLGYEVNYA